MGHLHNSGSILRIAFKYWTLKEDKRCMKIILMAYPKNILFGYKGAIWNRANGSTLMII